jgi:ABC-type multidrug transport system fused ATPase/permease subunit
LNFRTDIISASVIFVAGVGVVIGNLSPGWAGVVLVYSGQFAECLLWLIRISAELEMALNSVERVREYTLLPQEPLAPVESYRPRAAWPEAGQVSVKNLSVKYAADTPLVLKNLNFSTKAGEKIGIVGRTGAGKSSLVSSVLIYIYIYIYIFFFFWQRRIQETSCANPFFFFFFLNQSLAFFRIITFEEGTIEIDGLDVSKMGLHDLRSRLTIIPQDPVLFTGSLRSNLDPFEECDDAELWRVLKSTHVLESMKTQKEEGEDAGEGSSSSAASLAAAEAHPSGEDTTLTLEMSVSENGSNFSQGACFFFFFFFFGYLFFCLFIFFV